MISFYNTEAVNDIGIRGPELLSNHSTNVSVRPNKASDIIICLCSTQL